MPSSARFPEQSRIHRSERCLPRSAAVGPFNIKAIPHTTYSLQVSGTFAIGLKLHAHPADARVDAPWSYKPGLSPHCVQQFIASEYSSLVSSEIFNQAELQGSGFYRLTPNRYRHSAVVDFEIR